MQKTDGNLYMIPEMDGLAKIRVIGVGGGGCNAVDRMIEANVQGIECIAVNTDYQVLSRAKTPAVLRIGEKVTRGLGAGADPEKGQLAANESRDEIAKLIEGTDMLFITAGMGGGTGTGAAPVIASIAREMGILTVGVVTKPFGFEGAARKKNAEAGIHELEGYVDSLIVVPNDKLLEIADDDMSLEDAFTFADQVLKYGVTGISDLVAIPGMINLDLADVRRVMLNAGLCHMGIGRASGENRASIAIDEAIHSPLLDTAIDGAKRVIINFTGSDIKLKEISLATGLVRDAVSPEADIIFGTVTDPQMDGELMITVIASGFEKSGAPRSLHDSIISRPGSALPLTPNFLNQMNANNRPAASQRPQASSLQQAPSQPAPRPEPSRSGYNGYTPLTQEATNSRTSGYTPPAKPQQEEKPKKPGILPWFFSETEDNLDD